MNVSLDRIKAPRLNELRALIQVIRSTNPKLRHRNYIQNKYNRVATDFNISLGYLEFLGFIRMKKGFIYATDQFERLIDSNPNINFDFFSRLLIDALLSGRSSSVFLDRFFSLFKETEQGVFLVCTFENRLRYSGLRNLFIELGIIHYHTLSDLYEVEAKFAKRIAEISVNTQSGKFSMDKLLQQLENQRIIGEEAELSVIQYERERLALEPKLVDKIKHIAKINTGAGYDVLSWELTGEERYIEVKAVSLADFQFYWSSNEVDTSLRYGEQYFLYLTPVTSNGIDLAKIRIIQNPHENVLLNGKAWTKATRMYTIWKSKDDG